MYYHPHREDLELGHGEGSGGAALGHRAPVEVEVVARSLEWDHEIVDSGQTVD